VTKEAGMTHKDRPAEITAILETYGSGDNAEIYADLKTYITDLEGKRVDRPPRITTILRTIASQYPAEMKTVLEKYLLDLEVKQQPELQSEAQTPAIGSKRSPAWSHQRRIQLEKRRRELVARKRNNYQ
jgi:hypothetical protein